MLLYQAFRFELDPDDVARAGLASHAGAAPLRLQLGAGPRRAESYNGAYNSGLDALARPSTGGWRPKTPQGTEGGLPPVPQARCSAQLPGCHGFLRCRRWPTRTATAHRRSSAAGSGPHRLFRNLDASTARVLSATVSEVVVRDPRPHRRGRAPSSASTSVCGPWPCSPPAKWCQPPPPRALPAPHDPSSGRAGPPGGSPRRGRRPSKRRQQSRRRLSGTTPGWPRPGATGCTSSPPHWPMATTPWWSRTSTWPG